MLTNDETRGLHPGIRAVWRLSGTLRALLLVAALAVADVLSAARGVHGPLPAPLHALALLPVAVGFALWSAGARFRHWRFALDPASVVVEYGVFWRLRRAIPRARVQHVDVHSGPLDRLFGLAQVSLYTAGSMGPVATIPGLDPEEANALRDALIARDAV